MTRDDVAIAQFLCLAPVEISGRSTATACALLAADCSLGASLDGLGTLSQTWSILPIPIQQLGTQYAVQDGKII